jgi:hypothetical protein
MPSSGHAKCLRCEVVTAGNPWDWVQMCQGVTEFVSSVGDLAGSCTIAFCLKHRHWHTPRFASAGRTNASAPT